MGMNKYINYQIIDLDNEAIQFGNKHNSIIPALWVDGNMWFAGDFKIEKFEIKLNELLNNKRRIS